MQGSWGLTTEAAHTGVNSLTDSPGTIYNNNVDASATLAVYLPLTSRPYLSFWQRYVLEDGHDFGFVEASADNGNNWTRLYAVTGFNGTNWAQASVDLTQFKGGNVLLRFRIWTDGQNQYDGWYIDDVAVQANTVVAGYPYYDNMDGANDETNWLASAWERVDGSAQSVGGKHWACQVAGGGPGPSLNSSLTLAGTVDLSSASNPQLGFWWQGGANNGWANGLVVDVSGNGGQSWSQVWGGGGGVSPWAHVQLDLSPYVGLQQVMVRFRTAQYGGVDLSVDDVLISNGAAPVLATCHLSLRVLAGWEWLTLYGESGRNYLILSSTNLVNWEDFAILIPSGGVDEIIQPMTGNKVFYRAKLMP